MNTIIAILFLTTKVRPFTRKETFQKREVSMPLFYYPKTVVDSTYVPSAAAGSASLTGGGEPMDLDEFAHKWARSSLQLSADDSCETHTSYMDPHTGLFHAYMTKFSGGLPITNSFAGVVATSSGDLVYNNYAWTDTSSSPPNLVKRGEGITCTDALSKFALTLNVQSNTAAWKATTTGKLTVIQGADFAIGDVRCEEMLYETQSNGLRHVYSLEVPASHQYMNVLVDIATGDILAADDFTSHMRHSPTGGLVARDAHLYKRQANLPKPTFRALQLGALDPRTVAPSLINDPVDYSASPNGWFGAESSTSGNNVVAVENSQNARLTSQLIAQPKATGPNFVFDFLVDDRTQAPNQYRPASITNAFFQTNRYHDIMYKYGFDEAAGNFQNDNFGKGGQGNDAVIAAVQDGSGTNNANFASPPDGRNGIMRMFIFDATTPDRDGAFENSIVIHELTHGLSNRLTGGANNGNCLSSLESGGMGEGWSDVIAVMLEIEQVDTVNTPKPVGQYATGNAQRGVRSRPYSTNLQVNNLKYSDVPRNPQVHRIGEVWASMLFDIYWYMVGKAGFDPAFRTNPQGTNGNNQWLKTVITAMKIQPCNPTFVQARDAIVAADRQISNGNFNCEIFKGFARRGLGTNVRDDGRFVDDFTLPAGCQ